MQPMQQPVQQQPAQMPQPNPQQPMQMGQPMPEQKKGGWMKWLFIILGIAIVVGLLFVLKII